MVRSYLLAARARARLALELGDGGTPLFCLSGVDKARSSDHPFSSLVRSLLYGIPNFSAHSAKHRVSPLNVIMRFWLVLRACCIGVDHLTFPGSYPLSFLILSRVVPGGGSPIWA